MFRSVNKVITCDTFMSCECSQRNFTLALLQRYRKALEMAVQISCRYNVPPLPGRTFIMLCTDSLQYCKFEQKTDFCLPPDPDEKDEDGEGEEEENENPRASRKKKKKNDEDDKLTPSVRSFHSFKAVE